MISMMILSTMKRDPCFRIMIKRSKTPLMAAVAKNLILNWRNSIWSKVIAMWKGPGGLELYIMRIRNMIGKTKLNMWVWSNQKQMQSWRKKLIALRIKTTTKNKSLIINQNRHLREIECDKKDSQIQGVKKNTTMNNAINNAEWRINKRKKKEKRKSKIKENRRK